MNMGMLCRSLATSPSGAFTGQDPSGPALFPHHYSIPQAFNNVFERNVILTYCAAAALVRESLRLAKRAVKIAPASYDCWCGSVMCDVWRARSHFAPTCVDVF